MKILVVDIRTEQEKYKQAFRVHNYEDNNLMFCNSFQEAKEFLANQLETLKHHIDAIVVANTAFSNGGDAIKAKELLAIRNMLTESYSGGNFRICAIPMILVTPELPNGALIEGLAFDAVVEKNKVGDYTVLIGVVEQQVRRWRQYVTDDLDELGLNAKKLKHFVHTQGYQKKYLPRIAKRAEMFFVQHTKVVSIEFIRNPGELEYDWLTASVSAIERQVLRFGKGFRKHKPYNRYDNENTILHPLLMENPAVLLRDNYASFLHERGFPEYARFSKRPDFILRPSIPEYMNTEWFEVKKENVSLLRGKSKKDKYPTADLTKFALQLWRYKKFAENKENETIIENRLGYKPGRFSYVLLAGRGEEKDKYQEEISELMIDQYYSLQLVSYEDLERLAKHYLERFDRLIL